MSTCLPSTPPGAAGPVLIVYTAEPGGPDDERLRLLAGMLDASGPDVHAALQPGT